MKTYSLFYSAGSAGNVRGKQVAQLLGAKENPKSGFEDDLCIYVKVRPSEKHPKQTFLDVDDATDAVKWLKTHHDTGIIVNSEMSKNYLVKELKRIDIKVIPHMHCNYENWVRPDRPVKTVGIIGSKTSFKYPIKDLKNKLEDIGLNLSYNEDYWKYYGDEKGMTEDQRRLKVVDFYKQIDIQIVWRPDKTFSEVQKPLKNPNKLVNASAFGIPTVAFPEEGFEEWKDYYFQAYTIDFMFKTLEMLKKSKQFPYFSNMLVGKAKPYHRDEIIKLYQAL